MDRLSIRHLNGSAPTLCGMPIRAGIVFAFATVLASIALVSSGRSEPPEAKSAEEGPSFSKDGRLNRPLDFREWVFLTSGLGMSYGPAKAAENESPRFDNVFVNRPSYREFLKSGTWPDQTMLILEVRKSEANVSINNGGRTQGDLVAIEAAVKDRERFPDGGWGYYSFDGPDGPADSAEVLPASSSCYSCHSAKAAVDNTFVQFYPTLIDVAKQHKTFKLTNDKNQEK